MDRAEALKFAVEVRDKLSYRLECSLKVPARSYYEKLCDTLTWAIAALREQEQREQGCEWCQDEIMFDGEDMELVLRHPLEDAERAVYPNFCPMCGRKLGGAEE